MYIDCSIPGGLGQSVVRSLWLAVYQLPVLPHADLGEARSEMIIDQVSLQLFFHHHPPSRSSRVTRPLSRPQPWLPTNPPGPSGHPWPPGPRPPPPPGHQGGAITRSLAWPRSSWPSQLGLHHRPASLLWTFPAGSASPASECAVALS